MFTVQKFALENQPIILRYSLPFRSKNFINMIYKNFLFFVGKLRIVLPYRNNSSYCQNRLSSGIVGVVNCLACMHDWKFINFFVKSYNTVFNVNIYVNIFFKTDILITVWYDCFTLLTTVFFSKTMIIS